MGYYTHFKIVLGKSTNENKEQLIKDIKKYCSGLTSFLEYEYTNYDYNDIVTEYGEYVYGKWYNFEEEMVELSKHYPNLNITVNGHGEQIGDEWVLYVKAGKTEKHHVEFPKSTLWKN